ncbi:MAG: hypothetical protein KAI39_09960 [Desulfobulbaceae bacterium]|nr:hypothetical protein [Desulfobulbaceae bacterium]
MENFKKGLTEQETIAQKKLRDETKKGMRPKCKTEAVSSDRGKFKIK